MDMNDELFPSLPAQRPPRTIVFGSHALLHCSACDGTGEGELVWPDDVMPCGECGGSGKLIRRLPA